MCPDHFSPSAAWGHTPPTRPYVDMDECTSTHVARPSLITTSNGETKGMTNIRAIGTRLERLFLFMLDAINPHCAQSTADVRLVGRGISRIARVRTQTWVGTCPGRRHIEWPCWRVIFDYRAIIPIAQNNCLSIW